MSKYKIVAFNTIVGRNSTSVEEDVISEGGFNDFTFVHVYGENKKAFLQEAADADGIVAWTYLGSEEWKSMPKCKIIVSPGIGIDRFDLKEATESGVFVANVPDYCVEEVAVHTVAMLLDCTRKLTNLDRTLRNGIWKVMSCGKMYRMKGKTYGLMSFGHIPQRITELMKPFGVSFVTYDPFVSDELLEKYGVKRAISIEELFSISDYISVHTPYMKATHHIIGREQLECMKDEAILVVTGRGGVIDEDALKEALDRGKPVMAGIDVIEDEVNYQSVLRGVENVVMTPHSAYYSEEANEDLRRKTIEQIVEVVRNKKPPHNLMNKEVLGKSRMEK